MTRDGAPTIRRARGEDFADAAAMMNSYHVDLLSPDEREHGYLLATFTGAQLAAIDATGTVIVAHIEGRLAGCLCGSRLDAIELPQPAQALCAFLREIDPAGRRFGPEFTLLYGPVCIDRASRGRGILRDLLEHLRTWAYGRFTNAVALVSSANLKSIAVHRDGMGMRVLGEFPYAGERLLALSLPLHLHGDSSD